MTLKTKIRNEQELREVLHEMIVDSQVWQAVLHRIAGMVREHDKNAADALLRGAAGLQSLIVEDLTQQGYR